MTTKTKISLSLFTLAFVCVAGLIATNSISTSTYTGDEFKGTFNRSSQLNEQKGRIVNTTAPVVEPKIDKAPQESTDSTRQPSTVVNYKPVKVFPTEPTETNTDMKVLLEDADKADLVTDIVTPTPVELVTDKLDTGKATQESTDSQDNYVDHCHRYNGDRGCGRGVSNDYYQSTK